MRRRSLLAVPVPLAVAACLGSCAPSGGESPQPSQSEPKDANGGGTESSSPSASRVEPVKMDGTTFGGRPMSVEVGPVVRAVEHTVVRLRFTTELESAGGVHLDGWGTLLDVCLLSLEQGLVWPEIDTEMRTVSVYKDKPVDFFPVYSALGKDVKSVQVLVPNYGVALNVPVVEEADADFSVSEVLGQAKLDRPDKDPIALAFYAGAADGSLDVENEAESVVVALSSDVTFATDSAELSSAADEVLGTVAAELGKYPSGGSLAIVGHTDDVADNAYNQDLSERRAASVNTRLGQLADLSAWQVTVEGKGESEPRIDDVSDEARAANRRVEVIISAKDPSEGDDSAAIELGELPEAEGPVGRGPDGVEVDWKHVGGKARFEISQVTRIGNFLAGEVVVTALGEGGSPSRSMTIGPPLHHRWSGRDAASRSGAENLTLLVGGMRYLLADFTLADGETRPLIGQNSVDLSTEASMRLPAVWPDTGQESIVIDLPSNPLIQGGPVLRMTDIPVVEG